MNTYKVAMLFSLIGLSITNIYTMQSEIFTKPIEELDFNEITFGSSDDIHEEIPSDEKEEDEFSENYIPLSPNPIPPIDIVKKKSIISELFDNSVLYTEKKPSTYSSRDLYLQAILPYQQRFHSIQPKIPQHQKQIETNSSTQEKELGILKAEDDRIFNMELEQDALDHIEKIRADEINARMAKIALEQAKREKKARIEQEKRNEAQRIREKRIMAILSQGRKGLTNQIRSSKPKQHYYRS